MAHIFNYAVITALPDLRRGERVNIGIAVFLPDRLDIRMPEVAKLRALRDGDWDDYLAQLRSQLVRLFSAGDSAAQFLQKAALVEGVVRFSEPAAFRVDLPEQYEGRVKEIMGALVTRPRTEKKPPQTRINSEIARTFRAAKVLAGADDSLNDGKKVFPNYPISPEEELNADFIVKNSAYHVAVTLDLRRTAVNKALAALKAIVLDKSDQVLTGEVQKIAVYAASDVHQYRPHIGILTDYADKGSVFNWLDLDQRTKFTRAIYGALSHSGDLGLPRRD